MGELARYEEVFHRLLFDRDLRAQVRAGDWSAIADVAADFDGIDMDELDKLAVAVRGGLLRGSLGGLSIADAFPQTIEALGGGGDQVVERYLGSTGAAAPDGRRIDATGRRDGISILEAFYEWAAAELSTTPSAWCRAQHELAAALLRALTRTRTPGFLVQWSLVHRWPEGAACVLDAARPLMSPSDAPEQPVVYVSVAGRYATGRLSLDLAAIVLSQVDEAPAWALTRLEGLETETIDAARRALADRGLA